MDQRKIEIQMATAGASEAASEIDKTSQAVRDLTEETEQHATAAKQDTQIGIDRALVFEKIGQTITTVSRGMAQMADGVRADAPQMAANIDRAAGAMNSLGSAADGAAKGFAVGGPFGAAVGALVGATLPALQSAFQDMISSMAGVEASQLRLADSARKLQAALAGQANIEWLITAAENFDRAASAAAKLSEQARRAKLATASEADAEVAERDLADEQAIAAGADEIAVGRERAAWDASRARSGITTTARNLVGDSTRALGVRNDAAENLRAATAARGADSEEAKAAAKELADAQKALAAALRAQLDFEARAPGLRRKIDAEEASKMTGFDSRETARANALEAQHAAENDRLERAAAREAERDAERRESARVAGARRTGAGAEGIADAAFSAGASGGFVADLRRRAAAVQANPSAGNEAALAQLLDQLLRSLETGKGRDAANAAELKRRIIALERREKNR